MMKNIFQKQSILFTITITFIVSLLLIVFSFVVLNKNLTQKNYLFEKKRGMDVSRMLLRECRQNSNNISDEFRDHLNNLHFELITDRKEQTKILEHHSLIVMHTRKINRAFIKYIQVKDQKMIHIKTPFGQYLLVDQHQFKNHQFIVAIIFLIIAASFVMLYFITLGKLKPLKKLQEDVKKLANEEFDINCKTNNEDEISKLANEFHNTAHKLKDIKESRNIFIRNIMHELKTPITKGKVLNQLENTEENNQKMQMVFHRLESLIAEFATIEELISTKKALNTKEYGLEDIVDNSIDLLMCEENCVVKEYDDIRLKIDFNLFSIAIKNLIDNGLKYSKEKTVLIKTDENKIIFENHGEKLKYPLEKYFEPFFKGDDVKSNQSFGLGLYIVQNILKAHGMQLDYKYEDDKNIFIILT